MQLQSFFIYISLAGLASAAAVAKADLEVKRDASSDCYQKCSMAFSSCIQGCGNINTAAGEDCGNHCSFASDMCERNNCGSVG
ncbi:hypothetical protein E4U21_007666 [Claviceps maximensis]|nr:hypothetical protein E4U21_007666 [Claviceps maximensis]